VAVKTRVEDNTGTLEQ